MEGQADLVLLVVQHQVLLLPASKPATQQTSALEPYSESAAQLSSLGCPAHFFQRLHQMRQVGHFADCWHQSWSRHCRFPAVAPTAVAPVLVLLMRLLKKHHHHHPYQLT
jgi:hypothetical protein